MAVKKLLQIGDPKLKAPNLEVTDSELRSPELEAIITALTDTMRAAGLVGIAAPQIGINKQIFLTELRETPHRSAAESDQLRVYINPRLNAVADEQILLYEGCGSIVEAGLFGPVKRPAWVEVSAKDDNGELFRLRANGILGRVLLHELDHLQGKEFIDHCSEPEKLITAEHYAAQIKSADWHLLNSKISMKELS